MSPKDFDQFSDQIYRMMSDMFKDAKPLGYQPDRSFSPPMDIYETEDHLVVVLEIAGMKAEDIHVTFDKDILSISGFRKEPSTPPKPVSIRWRSITGNSSERSGFFPAEVR